VSGSCRLPARIQINASRSRGFKPVSDLETWFQNRELP
jgi:hypothetical protein